tara:strand:+ start:158 stop:358 length:201 start_codon:yes stop_codon:yes gene_type:complete
MNTYEISIRFNADSKAAAVELAEDVAPHLDGRALGWAMLIEEVHDDDGTIPTTILHWEAAEEPQPF